MIRERSFLRIQKLIFALCILLTLFFVFVFIPVLDRNKRLEIEVQQSYNDLVALNRNSPYRVGTDATSVETNLVEIRPRINMIRQAYLRQAMMLQLPKGIQTQVHAPFQTFEFILARNELSSNLEAKAQEKNVSLDASVLAGLPEYHYGMPKPQLLWTRLQACDRVLNSLIDVAPALIQSFSLQPDKEYYESSLEAPLPKNQTGAAIKSPNGPSQAASTNEPPQEVLFLEVPIHVQFVGNMEAVLSFLRDFGGSIPASMEKEIMQGMLGVKTLDEAPKAEEGQEIVADATAPIGESNSVIEEAAADGEVEVVAAAEEVEPPSEAADEPLEEQVPEEVAENAVIEEGSEEQVEVEGIFKNSLFLGPFELHLSPDNPDHVILNAIVSSIFNLSSEVHE
ncbi:MAG: hypothetical protein ACOX2U_07405 [Limisphaerales bacterium]|jgi:hypothetical protein|nr:hypothetical protein [Verrucomicrobiota bacterium]